MPASQASLQVTDAYRARLLEARRRAVTASTAAWARIDPDDLSGSFATWLTTATAVTEAAQVTGVQLTRQYLAAYLTSELGRRVSAPDTGEAAVGVDVFGRPVARALLPPLLTAKVRLAQGATPGQALAHGRNRAARLIAATAMAAPRAALASAIENDSRIIGWRRVTSSNACGACLGSATGHVQRDAETLLVHDACRCSKEPVVRGVRERVQRPTGADLFAAMTPDAQDALFAGRGGADKADLVRTGRAELADLILRQPMVLGGEQITETPLAALAA